jgi:hypothetical protein
MTHSIHYHLYLLYIIIIRSFIVIPYENGIKVSTIICNVCRVTILTVITTTIFCENTVYEISTSPLSPSHGQKKTVWTSRLLLKWQLIDKRQRICQRVKELVEEINKKKDYSREIPPHLLKEGVIKHFHL